MTTAIETVEKSELSLTPDAVERIKEVCADQGDNILLRLSVEGGGCSGFRYMFDIIDKPESDDVVMEQDGVKLATDPASLDFLKGAEIHFRKSPMGSAFVVQNPNAASSCGCGGSFSM